MALTPSAGAIVETQTASWRRPGAGAIVRLVRALWRRRWLILWAGALAAFCVYAGLPSSRTQIFVIVGLGLIASTVGTKTSWMLVVVDFLPFYAMLVAYDALRGSVGTLFRPHAIPQIRVDEWLFGGTVPTVRLQHAFYTPGVAHFWDYAAFGVYMTHFILPFAIAGILWRCDHARFYRYATLLLGLTFAAFMTYAIYPAVPPWMASRDGQIQPTSKILDEIWTHLGFANGAKVFSGTGHFANPVAAVPSLHSAYPMLIALFFWNTAGRWRPLLIAYPLAMSLALVYTGEHYVIDVLLGWLYATVVYLVGSRLLDQWQRRRAARADATRAPQSRLLRR